MQRFGRTASAFLILVSALWAQSAEPVPASDDVSLQFGTDGGSHLLFHLGELIPVTFSYAADTPGKYIWVSQSAKLAGGRALEISCSPGAERLNSVPVSYEIDKFAETLNACGGVGGGIGSGCGDCDSEHLLGTVSFGPIPLNRYVRFRRPGTYTCEASSADVTMTSSAEKFRPALLVKSNPLVLNIVDDPVWSHAAAGSYAAAYDKLCRSDHMPGDQQLQCFDISSRITYLDTVDSLATEVRFFDGRNHGWDNGFWKAIQDTPYPPDALRLMTDRIQESDVEVSQTVLESLASWDLRFESPDAFLTAPPAAFHAQAVDKLRKYVRLLGSSLANKKPNVFLESLKTYRIFAEQHYCEQQPLISKKERDQVLASRRPE